MTERAALFMLEADPSQAAWRIGGRTQRGALDALAACGADAYVWLIDGRLVQLAEADLPPGNRRVQAQALPYALEDQILTPVDDLGFASHRLSPTRLASAVFCRATLEARLDELAAAGIDVRQCVPDILCVPWLESTWTLLVAGEAMWLRTGPYAGQRFEASQWRAFVEQALVGSSGEQHVRVFGADDELLAQLAASSPALVIDVPPRAAALDLPALFAEGHAQAHLIDLLGALPRRREAGDDSARRWWWATAALLILAALAHAGFMQWHVSRLEARLAATQTATLDLFHAMFPGVTRVEDIRVQATQALAEHAAAQRQGAPFLDLLAAAGQGMTQQAADGLQLESASYGNGALELRVRANDMSALERYQQSLATATLPVQMLSVENRDRQAVALLRVGQPR